MKNNRVPQRLKRFSLTEEPQAEDHDEAGAGIVPKNGGRAVADTPASSSGPERRLRAAGQTFLRQ